MNFRKYIDTAFELINSPTTFNKHFSFIVLRNTPISIGFSQVKTNPKAIKIGYKFGTLHSEFDAILKCPLHPSEFKRCKLINIRVNSHGNIGMSKPCIYCIKMLSNFSFKEIFYSERNGNFVNL